MSTNQAVAIVSVGVPIIVALGAMFGWLLDIAFEWGRLETELAELRDRHDKLLKFVLAEYKKRPGANPFEPLGELQGP